LGVIVIGEMDAKGHKGGYGRPGTIEMLWGIVL
jgi:hypothetical protein